MTVTRVDASLWPAPTEADKRRFFAKCAISPATGCWVWLGAKNRAGYGQFGYAGIFAMAHAFASFMVGRPCPVGLEHDHLCRNTSCVNPDHVEHVTCQENRKRAGRAITHCKSGHPFDDANTYIRPCGGRACRECRREANRRYEKHRSRT